MVPCVVPPSPLKKKVVFVFERVPSKEIAPPKSAERQLSSWALARKVHLPSGSVPCCVLFFGFRKSQAAVLSAKAAASTVAVRVRSECISGRPTLSEVAYGGCSRRAPRRGRRSVLRPIARIANFSAHQPPAPA